MGNRVAAVEDFDVGSSRRRPDASAVASADSAAPAAAADPPSDLFDYKASLKQYLSESGAAAAARTDLAIVFSNMHGLYGGVELTVCGDGTVTQVVVRETAPDVKETVSIEEVKMIVRKVIKVEGWKQDPEALNPPFEPDTSFQSVTVQCEGNSSKMEEVHQSRGRVLSVYQVMKKVCCTS